MHFLGAILLGIVIMLFTADPRNFLRVALGASAIGVAVIVLGFFAIMNANERHAERRRIASTLIRPDQIEIVDARLALTTTGEITGIVVNRSPHTISELHLKVTVTDCPATPVALDGVTQQGGVAFVQVDASQDIQPCGIIGDEIASMGLLNVPPGQKRSFSSVLHFPGMPKTKQWGWMYSVKSIVARY